MDEHEQERIPVYVHCIRNRLQAAHWLFLSLDYLYLA